MARGRDFYADLGVARTSSQEEIQRAYRTLARRLHPDVNKSPDGEERFKDISEAYAVLSDPDQRRRYDAFGEDFRRVPEDVDPETWARAGAGAGAGAGGFRGGFGGEVDIEDIIGGMFGGGRVGRTGPGGGGWGAMPGADQESEIEVSVEEAYRGTRRGLSVSGPEGTRGIEVSVPAGVTEGRRIRLAGQGGRGRDGGTPGDLYLIVRIRPDARYRVEGRDVHTRLPVTPWEAALGTTAPLETPGGETKVTVPAGSSSGRRLRLRGRGLPNPRGRPGDVYAEIQIVVPPSLGPDERRLFEELAHTSTFDPRRGR
jgi:curved DNA-binding protein